jgi:hypothetical protein
VPALGEIAAASYVRQKQLRTEILAIKSRSGHVRQPLLYFPGRCIQAELYRISNPLNGDTVTAFGAGKPGRARKEKLK